MPRHKGLSNKSQRNSKIQKRAANERANETAPYNLNKILTYARNFEKHLDTIQYKECKTCKKRSLELNVNRENDCTKCVYFAQKNKLNKFTSANNMDPLEVPDELKYLTPVEEMLIARIHPIICVYKIRGGQTFYAKQVINFPQNVKEFAKQLPISLNDLSNILIVRRGVENGNFNDFRVDKVRVFNALKWLIKNNEFYKDIEINEENLNEYSTDLLENLPINEQVEVVNEANEHFHNLNERQIDVEEEVINIITQSERNSLQELSDVLASENNNINARILNWPNIESEPINEYKTEGYIACAFPKLFPYGKADFRDGRVEKLTPKEYFKHLILYKDGRFAKHQRFRYFALNSLMRWKSSSNAKLFIKKSDLKDMSPKALIEKITKEPNFANLIKSYNQQLRSTSSYWYLRSQELLDMIDQIGPPTFFITLSAADNFWPELFATLRPEMDLENMVYTDRIKIQTQLLNENPLEASLFFSKRVKYFIEKIVKPHFKIVDHWYRIEFQSRGSPHVHGVFWASDVPDVTVLNEVRNSTNEYKFQDLINYFDSKLTAMLPENDTDNINNEQHPCMQHFTNIENHEEDLQNLLNKCQMHKHTSYCLKNGVCRFGFPKDIADKADFIYDEAKKRYKFMPKRNNPLLNSFERTLLELWRANIDIQPITNFKEVLYYIVKYASKTETKGQNFIKILTEMNDQQIENATSKGIISKLLMNLVAAREFSSQEVCYLLNSLPLFSCSREFKCVNINFNSDYYVQINNNEEIEENEENEEMDYENEQSEEHFNGVGEIIENANMEHENTSEENEFKKCSQPIKEYCKRPAYLENLTFFEFFSQYKFNKSKKQYVKKTKNEIILRTFPKTSEIEVKMMIKVLLHSKYRNLVEFFDSEGNWIADSTNMNIEENTNLNDLELELRENEYNYTQPDCENENFEQWQQISASGHNQVIENFDLGEREFDKSYPFFKNTIKDEELKQLKNFIKNKKLEQQEDEEEEVYRSVTFNSEQKNVIDHFENQINCYKTNNFNIPKLTIVEGKAGSGKSTIIKYFKKRCNEEFSEESLLILAPTGVAAINVNGSTIQSKLKMIINNGVLVNEITGINLSNFQSEFRNVKFIVIDEMSMVGCKMLGFIDKRLRTALPHEEKKYFGGLCVYLFGDFNQLTPVKDSPLFNNCTMNSVSVNLGKNAFSNFNKYFYLSSSVRQQDAEFRAILDRVGDAQITIEDWRKLNNRSLSKLNNSSDFENALHLYAKNSKVNKKNKKMLASFNLPVCLIKAEDTSKKNLNTQISNIMPDKLTICIGCLVMLRTNLWVEKGLVNGAMGKVIEIIYKENSIAGDSPEVILVKFENYTGPTYKNLVPIPKITKSTEFGIRKQFPLQLAYAITIHKSQGLTLDKVVVNLGKREIGLGSSYVALSRVKTFEGLAFEKSID